ncbi:MAG: hypothetical protein U0163_10330 [Gemmatimonadaceae bacterium]
MIVDPGDWLPLFGLTLVAGCTIVGVAGAWAAGRARGVQDALRKNDELTETKLRIERMEQSLTAVAQEIERLGEVQRFALKLIGERVADAQEIPRAHAQLGRVITPH